MKYRVQVDLSFDTAGGAQALMDYAVGLSEDAVSINEGQPNEEISYCHLELCGHDEGQPCTTLQRVEVRNL